MSQTPGLPADDAPVGDSTPIYRLVPIEQCEVLDGAWMFRSGAFDNSSEEGYENEMSVVLGDTLQCLERDPRDLPRHAYANTPERWGVAVLEAGCIGAVNEQTIHRTPTPQERAHGDVVGKKNTKRRRRLKACATWVVPPEAPVP